MRAIIAVIILIASSGMIYAGFTADAPVPGIDYDVEKVVQDSCTGQPTPGDRLMNLVSGGDRGSSVDAPNDTTVTLLTYLTCGLLDD
jgi:hypothetical protein